MTRYLQFLVCPLVAVLLCGCAAFNNQRGDAQRILGPIHNGDLGGAAINAKAAAEVNANGADAVLAYLEAGAVLQAAGRTADSQAAFAAANHKIVELDGRATLSVRDVGGQLGTLLANPKLLPYRGSNADRILMHTLQALNYLEQNDVAGARVELNRAYERQQDAVRRFQKQIEDAGAGLSQRQLDPGQVNLGQARRALRHTGSVPTAAYSDFVNPLTTYLDGIFFMATAANGSDLERARKSLERTAAFVPEPAGLDAERDWLAARAVGQKPAPVVLVLTATGLGPRREEWRLDLPIPTRPVVHAGLALPRLAFDPVGDDVKVAGANSIEIADLYATVAREFDETFDAVVLQAVTGAATKAVAQVHLGRELGELGLLAGVLGSVSLTQADLRSWRTAPARVSRAWLPRPADGKLRLQRMPGAAEETIELPDGEFVLVYVRRMPGSPLHVSAIGIR